MHGAPEARSLARASCGDREGPRDIGDPSGGSHLDPRAPFPNPQRRPVCRRGCPGGWAPSPTTPAAGVAGSGLPGTPRCAGREARPPSWTGRAAEGPNLGAPSAGPALRLEGTVGTVGAGAGDPRSEALGTPGPAPSSKALLAGADLTCTCTYACTCAPASPSSGEPLRLPAAAAAGAGAGAGAGRGRDPSAARGARRGFSLPGSLAHPGGGDCFAALLWASGLGLGLGLCLDPGGAAFGWQTLGAAARRETPHLAAVAGIGVRPRLLLGGSPASPGAQGWEEFGKVSGTGRGRRL